MYCVKCEAQDFNILTGISIGPSRGVSGTTKSWTLLECKVCGYYKLVTEETREDQHDTSNDRT